MKPDPFYKRSSFGSLLFMLGTLGIYWLVEEKDPTAQDWIQVLVLGLTVFGYTVGRPTGPLPRS